MGAKGDRRGPSRLIHVCTYSARGAALPDKDERREREGQSGDVCGARRGMQTGVCMVCLVCVPGVCVVCMWCVWCVHGVHGVCARCVQPTSVWPIFRPRLKINHKSNGG